MESAFSKFDNYTFYQVDTSILSISSLFIAVVILTMIFIMAWKHGRTWCNTICPVGTILGLLSRFSLFKVRIDSDKCNSCGLCATKCKAACINSKEHTIDYGRCVDCFDCLGGCKQKALIYQPSLSPTDSSKRRFLVAGLLTAGAVKESVASLEGKKVYKKENPVTPPGSVSREHFQQQCTSCHLCISKCPSHVLKPEGDGATVGCGALSIIWENMAEVRSLAVAAHARRKGCGRLIVEACIAEARELDIHRLFALTYQLPFFNALGFSIVEKEVLPQKVWVDCVNCPKFPDCDETAVLLEI